MKAERIKRKKLGEVQRQQQERVLRRPNPDLADAASDRQEGPKGEEGGETGSYNAELPKRSNCP